MGQYQTADDFLKEFERRQMAQKKKNNISKTNNP